MKTEPVCAECRKVLNDEKRALLKMLNRNGVYPKAYCDQCYFALGFASKMRKSPQMIGQKKQWTKGKS